MSESKRCMSEHLSNVQKRLMGMGFESLTLDSLLPIIFEECSKENLTFWFSFIENGAVLNLRDTRYDNYELNIRQYPQGVIEAVSLTDIKLQLLTDTFLIIADEVAAFSSPEESENPELPKKEDGIIDSDKITPEPVRTAIEKIKGKGIDVTKEAINNHVHWGKLSNAERIQCKKYLANMGAS